jgi:CheY-like chemotaxis protein
MNMAGNTLNKPTSDEPAHRMEGLLRVLVWPAVVLGSIILFVGPLSGLIDRILNVEVSNEKGRFKVALVAANLTAAEAARPDSTPDANRLTAVASSAARHANEPALNYARVLWVDDNPDNNVYERQALGAMGIEFDLAMSTAEAMEQLSRQTYSVIISDFNRRDDPRGGYTLLEKVKQFKNPPPFILYTSSANPAYQKDAQERGAYAETNSPRQLFDLVIHAILQKT